MAYLFDLDETLVVDEPAAVAAFEATPRHAATSRPLDIAALAVGARSRARELWYAAPTHPYCRRIGISSWEGLWCRFELAASGVMVGDSLPRDIDGARAAGLDVVWCNRAGVARPEGREDLAEIRTLSELL